MQVDKKELIKFIESMDCDYFHIEEEMIPPILNFDLSNIPEEWYRLQKHQRVLKDQRLFHILEVKE